MRTLCGHYAYTIFCPKGTYLHIFLGYLHSFLGFNAHICILTLWLSAQLRKLQQLDLLKFHSLGWRT